VFRLYCQQLGKTTVQFTNSRCVLTVSLFNQSPVKQHRVSLFQFIITWSWLAGVMVGGDEEVAGSTLAVDLLGKQFTAAIMCLCTNQHYSVQTMKWWCAAAGKITAILEESRPNISLPWLHHLWNDCLEIALVIEYGIVYLIARAHSHYLSLPLCLG